MTSAFIESPVPKAKMRILIAWELGDNYGHVMRLLPIVRRLRARGHDVLLVLKDVLIAQQVLTLESIPFLQAPVPRRQCKLDREISNFGDILFCHGFADREALRSLIYSWQHIYRLYQPDVVVVDHAPAALFAAGLLELPTAEITMGFESPPATSPYHCFRPWLNVPQQDLLHSEAMILANLNSLCEEQQRPKLKQLSDFMQSDVRFLVTFPEIDHYPGRRNVRYLGSLFTQNDGLEADWPSGQGKNVFVYVRASSALTTILESLRRIDANIICVSPDIDPAVRSIYQSENFHIYTAPLKLRPLLKRCDLAVTYSGYGMVSACLLAGIPMLTIPTQIEQLLLNNRMTRLGVALGLNLSEISEHFESALTRLLTDHGFSARARALAEKYKTFNQDKVVEHIAYSLEKLAIGRQVKTEAQVGIGKAVAHHGSHSDQRTMNEETRRGRVALITGAGRGIGAAIAMRLAKEGMTVIVNYREKHHAAQEVVNHITSLGGVAHAIQADVSNDHQLEQLFAYVREKFGRLDVLVNNVGTAGLVPIERLTSSNIHQLLATNIQSVLLACKEAAGLFTASGGYILNISSITSQAGPAGSALYGASKAAVDGLTRSLAIELGRRKITVNAIAPGQIDTDLYRKLSNPGFDEYILSRTPLGRLGASEDVAAAAAFLTSTEANWITGQVLRVDGGFSY